MIFIIGGNGFIGSAFVRKYEKDNIPYEIITRKNYKVFQNIECDILINANGNSKKFIAENDPILDFDLSVKSVLDSLISFRYKKYIYLSTGDVYPNQSLPEITRECKNIDFSNVSKYGFHKLLAEKLISYYADDWLIFRMGGFIGPGLKKNAIYDMLNNQDIWISEDSELQFMSTDSLVRVANEIIQKKIKNQIINISGHGVVKLSKAYSHSKSLSKYKPDAKHIRFELSLEKVEREFGISMPKSIDEVFSYIDSYRK